MQEDPPACRELDSSLDALSRLTLTEEASKDGIRVVRGFGDDLFMYFTIGLKDTFLVFFKSFIAILLHFKQSIWAMCLRPSTWCRPPCWQGSTQA